MKKNSLDRLIEIRRQRQRRIVGLMSGTSADGLDLAVVDISNRPTTFRVITAGTVPYPPAMRRQILNMMDAVSCDFETLVHIHYRWAVFAAEKIRHFLQEHKIPIRTVDAVASHGQTLAHYPQGKRVLGGPARGTLQIGDPAVLAHLTGQVTVGDFRWSDIAAGGTGAPLSGYYHHLILSQMERNKGRRPPPLAVLNIGGIANISVTRIKRGQRIITAFDTGPGNCLSDTVMQLWGKKAFDRDGKQAAKGKVERQVLQQMKRHPFFSHRPPKSCGKEEFGSRFISRFYPTAPRKKQRVYDRLATVDELVARSIAGSREWLGKIGGIVVVGGGRHNRYLIERIGKLIAPLPLVTCDSLGLPGDYVEAIGFALLANETLSGRPGNLGGAPEGLWADMVFQPIRCSTGAGVHLPSGCGSC